MIRRWIHAQASSLHGGGCSAWFIHSEGPLRPGRPRLPERPREGQPRFLVSTVGRGQDIGEREKAVEHAVIAAVLRRHAHGFERRA